MTLADRGLTDEHRTLLEETADATIEGTLFNWYSAGIGKDMDALAENVIERSHEWTKILEGILVRRLEEEKGGDESLANVRPGEYEEIEEIAEERQKQIMENLM